MSDFDRSSSHDAYVLAPIDGTKCGAVGYDVYRGTVRSVASTFFIVSCTHRAAINALTKIKWAGFVDEFNDGVQHMGFARATALQSGGRECSFFSSGS